MKCNFLKKKRSYFLPFCYKVFFSFFQSKSSQNGEKIGYFMLFFKVYFLIFVYLKKESVLKPPIAILLKKTNFIVL